MTPSDGRPDPDTSGELAALRAIVEGTARHTGQEFFQSLVRHLAAVVGTRYAFVAEFMGGTRARTLAFWCQDRIADNYAWDVVGTPCEDVVRGNLCHYPTGVSQRFPEDKRSVGIESYLGVPLLDAQGRHLGHLAVFDDRPMPAEPRQLFIFRIFASRAAAELERLQFEEKLRESEQRWRSLTEEIGRLNQELRSRVDELQAILDIVPMGIAIAHDPEGRRITHNPYLSEVTGVPLGKNASFGAPPDERPQNHGVYQDGKELLLDQMPMQLACTGVEVRDFEMEIVRTDGGSRKLLCYVRPLRDAAGRVRGAVGGFLDITSRRQMEEALRQSEAQFRGTFENAGVGIAQADLEGCWLRVNEKFCAIVGYTREELLQKAFHDITYADDLSANLELDVRLKRGEFASYSLEKRYVRKDGSPVWVDLTVSLQRDATGAPANTIAIIQDISERKLLEAELRTSEERRRLILDNAHDAFVAMSADGLITEWNRHAEFAFGWSRAEAVGRVLSETIIPPQFREAHNRGLAHFLATGAGPVLNRVIDVAALRRDGREFPAEISIAPVRLGEQYLFAAFIRDVTERKRAEEEVLRAKEAAEAANRAKDEFLANVSHEIRTPMNAILGMTELALDTTLSEDQQQYLTTVKSAGDALLGIINDILDFAKIEAGRLELDPADFSLASVLGTTLRALGVRAHKKGLELVCQQRPDVPDALIGDAGRLRQVLTNLVGNAIKFTERGEIVVTVGLQNEDCRLQIEKTVVSVAADGSSSNLQSSFCNLQFKVSDTGIGIPPEKQAKIFRAFEQEDTSTTRKYGGTGLGLTIAARLVALMGGEITVDSEPRRGSTFAFTARFGLQPHPPEVAATSPPAVLRGLPVLIVDDNATNRHILEEWLRGYSMELTTAGDGVTAMAALWRGVAQGHSYPLALLDGRMPDIDGLALAAKIREHPELSATRLILLTSGDRPGDLTRARQLGISANLLKPLQQRELMETILRVMGHQKGRDDGGRLRDEGTPLIPQPSSFIPHSLVGVPLRILVAEDNEFNRDLLEHMFARSGLSATMATNGRDALDLLEREPFDLLLLDIHMPELDGFQVVEAIRARELRKDEGRRMKDEKEQKPASDSSLILHPSSFHLPVIALTARSRKEDRERCLRAGMDEYLAKPFNAEDLWAAIDRVLRKDEGRGKRDEGKRTILDSSLIPHPSSLALLDPPVLLAASGGDPTMLRKMCRSLQSRVPEYLTEIRDAVRDQDAPRLREAAHKFCGMLSTFSSVAGNKAADLEDLAARGLLNEALPVVEQLEQCAAELARLSGGLTIETLRRQAKAADDPNRTASP